MTRWCFLGILLVLFSSVCMPILPIIPKDLDAFLFSDPISVGYYTQFWGSFGRLLYTASGIRVLISDSRYSTMAKDLAKTYGYQYQEISHDPDFWKTLLLQYSITSLGIESEHVTLARFQSLQKLIPEVRLCPTEHVCANQRIIKTAQQKSIIQSAAAIADAAIAKTVASFEQGITEKELAWIFEKTAREEYGAEGLSFDTIVAFGANSAVAHHTPTDTPLGDNTPILIDCGVIKDKYCSDMTRCFWFGDTTTAEYAQWKKAYDAVLAAQQAGIAALQIGSPISNAEISARTSLGTEEQYFNHSFGHGVGLQIHELPHVSKNTKEVLQPGMIITAEPGLYYEDRFGIRIEDLLYITDTGVEYLSAFPKWQQ